MRVCARVLNVRYGMQIPIDNLYHFTMSSRSLLDQRNLDAALWMMRYNIALPEKVGVSPAHCLSMLSSMPFLISLARNLMPTGKQLGYIIQSKKLM